MWISIQAKKEMDLYNHKQKRNRPVLNRFSVYSDYRMIPAKYTKRKWRVKTKTRTKNRFLFKNVIS